jgi:hypothetical protein
LKAGGRTRGHITIRWSRRGGPPPYRGQSCALAAPQLKLKRYTAVRSAVSKSEGRAG